MPKLVEPHIFRIGGSVVDRGEVSRWMEYLGATEFELPDESAITSPAALIALAAKRCYKSFEPGLNPNVTRVRRDYVQFFDNILSSGHGSVLEHASHTYAIEDVSRVFTAEMNRHRAGWAISEGSLRFIRFNKDIPYWLPESLREQPGDDGDIWVRKQRSRDIFDQAFRNTERLYTELLSIWDMNEDDKNFDYKKKVTSCLRRIVPMGVASGGVWTGNIRSLRHVIAMRTDEAAEEEIAYVFGLIAEDIIRREPMLFQDFELPHHEPGTPYVPKYRKV